MKLFVKIPWKLLALAALVIGGVALSQWGPVAQFFAGPALRQWIEACRSSGWGPLAFVLLFLAGGIVALPAAGFLLLGGAVFGFWPGVAYNLLGCNLGALAAFGIARTLGRDAVRRFVQNDRLAKLESAVGRHGFWVILAIRVLPVFPYNLVNFGSGLVSVRLRDYAAGTLLGTLPAVALFSYCASVPGGGRNWKLETAVIAFAVLAIGAAVYIIRKTIQTPPVRPAEPVEPAERHDEPAKQQIGQG